MALQTLVKRSVVKVAMIAEELLRGRSSTSPADLTAIREFLFLQYMMPLGYCVHDTPIYEALRTCRPDAKITVATHGTGYQTLRHNPFIDTLITTTSPLRNTRLAASELKRALQARGIQPAVGITNCSNPRTRITLLNLLAGKHLRLGHSLAPGLYHLPQDYDRSMSLIDNNLRLLENFGCASVHVEPRVYFSEQDVAAVGGLLTTHGVDRRRPLVVLVTQNSGGQRTGWHTDRYAAVIRHVQSTRGCQAVFVGTAGDVAAIDALRAEAGNGGELDSISLAGKTSISELSALLAMSDFVISLDTGTMHIGRAAGVPMVVLGPSWQKPLEWLPLGNPRVRILRGDDLDHVPENYHLDEVQVDSVTAAFDELFELYPASESARAERVASSLSRIDHASTQG